ncbi:MAG: hypothetical protein AB1489_31870, partial [Acidobacteriota bacterium]
MKKYTWFSSITLLLVTLALLPMILVQAAPQAYAIRGAKIFTLAGPPIDNGSIVIRNGKIEAVGKNVAIPAGAQVIDAKGLQVYPGFFDAVSQLGLVEIGAVGATVDTNEMGEYNPQLIAATAINMNSEHIPVARANGITHTVSVPGLSFFGGGGTIIPGQASAINLSGWVIDEMLIRRAVAMVINWPTMRAPRGGFGAASARRRPFSEVKQEYEKRVNELG